MEKRITRRRLHTLSGAAALGFFLVAHLLTQATAIGGQGAWMAFAGAVERSRVWPLFELLFIVVPFAFHVGYGVVLWRGPVDEREVARYGSRVRWKVQRLTGILVLAFVLGHLWETRIQKLAFGLEPAAVHTVLVAHLSWTWAGIPFVALLYLLGLGVTCAHFANGLMAASLALGIGEDEAGRRKMQAGSLITGSLLFVLGALTVIALATGTRLHAWRGDDSAPCGDRVPAVPTPPTFR